jgi:hypothetical protein
VGGGGAGEAGEKPWGLMGSLSPPLHCICLLPLRDKPKSAKQMSGGQPTHLGVALKRGFLRKIQKDFSRRDLIYPNTPIAPEIFSAIDVLISSTADSSIPSFASAAGSTSRPPAVRLNPCVVC